MANTYTRKNWINDSTHLNADNLNNIENGIEDSLSNIQSNKTNIENNKLAIDLLNADKDTEDSIDYKIEHARKDLIGTYTYNPDNINENDTILGVKYRVDNKFEDLNDDITYIDTTLRNHLNNKSNPHNVTAEQVGAYSKESTFNKEEVRQEIIKAKDDAFIKIDKTSEKLNESSNGYAAYCIEDIANVEPIILYIDIDTQNPDDRSKFDGTFKIGHIDITDGNFHQFEDICEIHNLGRHKIVFEGKVEPSGQIVIEWYNDCPSIAAPLCLTVSYLQQTELLKILDYIDFTIGGNIISAGFNDPDETTNSRFYFKYSE